MIERSGNVRSGRTTRAAAFVLPALFALLGASGVTVKPILGMRELENEILAARQRAAACILARDAAARFDAEGGVAVVDHAIATVTEVLPEPLRPADVHALVTLCAERRAVEIVTLAILEDRAAPFARLADDVVETPVEIRGRSRLSGLADLAADLRRAGLPVSVAEFSVVRAQPGDEHFDFHLALALYQRIPASPHTDSDAPDPGREE